MCWETTPGHWWSPRCGSLLARVRLRPTPKITRFVYTPAKTRQPHSPGEGSRHPPPLLYSVHLYLSNICYCRLVPNLTPLNRQEQRSFNREKPRGEPRTFVWGGPSCRWFMKDNTHFQRTYKCRKNATFYEK